MRLLIKFKAFLVLLVVSICFFFSITFHHQSDEFESSNLKTSKKLPHLLAPSKAARPYYDSNATLAVPSETMARLISISEKGVTDAGIMEEGMNASQNNAVIRDGNSEIQRINQGGNILREKTFSPLILLSINKSVESNVRGNLGPPSVITQELVGDWLKDRWQGTSSSMKIALLFPNHINHDVNKTPSIIRINRCHVIEHDII